jgi:hypothetical protein
LNPGKSVLASAEPTRAARKIEASYTPLRIIALRGVQATS